MSAEDYRHLFESHPAAMLIYETSSLTIRATNEALRAELGYGAGELEAKSLLELHAPEDHARVMALIEPVRAGQVLGLRRVARDFRLRRKDGTLVEVECRAQAFVFDGKPSRLVLFREIGHELRARMFEERWRALFERARDPILLVAADGRILDANQAATETYGYWKEELVRMRIVELRDPATVPEVPKQMERAQGAGILFETTHRRKDGSTFPVEVSSASVELDGQKVLLSIIRDVSAQRGLQQKARAELAALADELGKTPSVPPALLARLRALL